MLLLCDEFEGLELDWLVLVWELFGRSEFGLLDELDDVFVRALGGRSV